MAITFQLEGSQFEGTAAEIGILSYSWKYELTEYQKRALERLSKEWKSVKEIVDEEFPYEAFSTLMFHGFAECRIVSPYTEKYDGYRIYHGSYHYFRLKE